MHLKYVPIMSAVLALVIGAVIGRISNDRVHKGRQAYSSDDTKAKFGKRIEHDGRRKVNDAMDAGRGKGYNANKLRDVDHLIAAAFADPKDHSLQLEWHKFVKDLNADEIAQVMDRMVLEGYSTEVFELYHAVWRRWGQIDPVGALERAQDPGGLSFESDPTYSSWATKLILITWSDKGGNTVDALRWVEENPDVPGADRALYVITTALGIYGQTEQAAQQVAMIADPVMRNAAIRNFASSLSQFHGPESAIEWASGMEDKQVQIEALSSVAKFSVENNSTNRIADWLLAKAGEDMSPVMKTYMEEMSKGDFQSALDYYEVIGNGVMKRAAYQGLVNKEAAAKDPQAMLGFMENHSEFLNDGAWEEFVEGAYRSDRSLAINSIVRINHSERREKAYRHHMLSWLVDDHEAAMQWVRENNMQQSIEAMLGELTSLIEP